MISIMLSLACAALLAFTPAAEAGEKLVYAVVYKSSSYAASKTEILAIDPETAEKRLAFEDEKTPIVLIQHLYVFHFPVAGGGKLFAHAFDRGQSLPFPGNGSLYELSADGANLFRKIAPVLGAESLGEVFVNPTGTRIGYISRLNKKQYVFIHDVATGVLLSQIDVSDKFLDCFASSIGWLPHGEKLYFSLETGDEHVTSKASYARVGTYLMDERGRHLQKLTGLPALAGFHPPETSRLIGMTPAGEYVFETMQSRKNPARGRDRLHFALLKAASDFSHVDELSFTTAAGLYSGIRVNYALSPSGRFLSAAALPVSSSAVSSEIWLKDLKTGAERMIVSIPTAGLQGPFPGLVGWLD